MKTKLRKWGNSLALRIPEFFAVEAALEPGSEVDLSLIDGRLVITPVPSRYSLEQSLEGVTEVNLHAEVDTGAPVGHEA